MNKERYLRINPNGTMNWILIDPSNMCSAFHRAIGCDFLENVYTILPDIVIIVDECGKIKRIPQPYNPVASKLYAGSDFGDPIVGPAIVAAIHLCDGESDWVPLSLLELVKVMGFLNIPPSTSIPEVDMSC